MATPPIIILIIGLISTHVSARPVPRHALQRLSSRTFKPNEFQAIFELMVQYRHGNVSNCPLLWEYSGVPIDEQSMLFLAHGDMSVSSADDTTLTPCNYGGAVHLLRSTFLTGSTLDAFEADITDDVDKWTLFNSLRSQLDGAIYYVSAGMSPPICGNTTLFAEDELLLFFDESETVLLSVVAKYKNGGERVLTIPLVGDIRYMVAVHHGSTCIYRAGSDIQLMLNNTARPSDSSTPAPSRSPSPNLTHDALNETNQDAQTETVELASATPSMSPSKETTSDLTSPLVSEVPSLSAEVQERVESDLGGSNETVSTASSPSIITIFLPNEVVSPPPTQAIESRVALPTPSMSPYSSSSPIFSSIGLPHVSPSPCPSPSMTPLKASLVSTVSLDDEMGPTVLDMPPVPTWALVSTSKDINVEIGAVGNGSFQNEGGMTGINGTEVETTPEVKKESSKEVTGGWFCFPGSAMVSLSDGSKVALSTLGIGDRVMVGDGSFSRVVAFTHRDVSAQVRFVRLHLTHGLSLRASAGHYIFSGATSRLIPMKNVHVGDVMQAVTEEGRPHLAVVHKVDTVWDQGLFNPQTESGDIVIDGVRASCYTEAVKPILGHSLLTVVRAVTSSLPWIASRVVSVGMNKVVMKVRHMVEPVLSKEL